tara:strand:- start:572 stop:1024 length:453 start_codon:yes stop_codon:yes gene_type:complete
MRRKILYLFTVLTFLLNISNKLIYAGPFTDEMAKCLVTSTNDRDRTRLVKWIFRVYGDHPEVTYMIDLSNREKKFIDKDVADLFTRLLSEDCIDETKKALDYEGENVMFNAFQILGQVAAQGFNNNPYVMKSINEFVEMIDYKKLDYLAK